MKKTSEQNVLGGLLLERYDVGDLVSWSVQVNEHGNKIKELGVISDLYVAERGDRDVAIAKVLPLENSLIEKELLIMSVELVSKAKKKNGDKTEIW
tara:strand:+ start:210 stop:497 length:288 start_codon:yes stop_codon:yes gene_type:complete